MERPPSPSTTAVLPLDDHDTSRAHPLQHHEHIEEKRRVQDIDAGLPSVKPLAPKLGDLGCFWNLFDTATDDYDDDMLTALKSNVDSLLIFAALFSAVNSAVVALSVPLLTPDSGGETNRLLRLLLQGANNNTLSSEELLPSFAPSSHAIRINVFFSISLTCSMVAAFGALLGQQWITSYRRRPVGGFEEERRERQRRLLGAKRWHLEAVLERLLPMLLQISLIVFLVGMVDYLLSLSFTVALPSAIICGLSVIFFSLTILSSLCDPHCPFKTPFSEVAGPLLAGALRWLRASDRVLLPIPESCTRWLADLAPKVGGYTHQWLIRKWPNEVLEAHSVRRILATSSDAKTLHAMALNVPLMVDNDAIGVIYADSGVVSHLHQLYATHSAQSSPERYVYAAAICHLVLAAGRDNPERDNKVLDGHELRIILDAAQGHVRNAGHPPSTLPSSTVTVALAFLLLELEGGDVLANKGRAREDYISFIRSSLDNTTTPDVSVATMVWILISSQTFMPDASKRSEVRAKLGFYESPLFRVQSGLFCYASEAYCKFFQYSCESEHYVSDESLLCVAQLLEYRQSLTETARPLFTAAVNGLADILNGEMNIGSVSKLAGILEVLHPLLPQSSTLPDEVKIAALNLMHAILRRTKGHSGIFPITISSSALEALKKYAGIMVEDKELREWLEAYIGPKQ